jgi:hypothetical protein
MHRRAPGYSDGNLLYRVPGGAVDGAKAGQPLLQRLGGEAKIAAVMKQKIENDKCGRVGIGERPNQEPIRDGKGRNVDANTQGECCHRDRGESRTPSYARPGVADVTPQQVEPRPTI